MSIQPVSLDNAFLRDKKDASAPANDNGRATQHERFPKVDDIVERLTHTTRVADAQND